MQSFPIVNSFLLEAGLFDRISEVFGVGGYYFSEIAGKKKNFFETVGVPVPDSEPEEQTEREDTDPDTAKSEVVV